MDLYSHVVGLIESVGIKPDDVKEVVVYPGRVVYRLWARSDDGGIATIASDIGDLPLSFEVSVAYEPPIVDSGDTLVITDQ